MTDDLTRIAGELEGLHDAATPAPWKHTPGTLKHYVHSTDEREEFGVSLQSLHWKDGGETRAEHNAALIAAMRSAAPALIAALRECAAWRRWQAWQPNGTKDDPGVLIVTYDEEYSPTLKAAVAATDAAVREVGRE